MKMEHIPTEVLQAELDKREGTPKNKKGKKGRKKEETKAADLHAAATSVLAAHMQQQQKKKKKLPYRGVEVDGEYYAPIVICCQCRRCCCMVDDSFVEPQRIHRFKGCVCCCHPDYEVKKVQEVRIDRKCCCTACCGQTVEITTAGSSMMFYHVRNAEKVARIARMERT